MGTLNLVDLAGSETRNRIKTAGHSMNINKSLINLGNVIYALSSSKSIHIPYKDSNLTRLLQDSLGGNAKTVLIANIGPADFNFEETLHTLRFANKVKTIKNKPKINDDQPCSFLREFQEYIEGLKVRLKEKEETIDRERKMIEVEKDLPDVDRARLLGDLAMPEEARKANQEHERISIRLKKLEKYVLKGSEAREYAYKQQEGMENLRKELEEKRLKEQQYARITDEQDIWKFSLRTTQDEINEKTREICKLSCKLERGKTELQELQDDFGEEKASYLQQISMLNSQLKLKDLVINYFIPQDVVAKTEAKSIWGQQEEDWILLSQDSLMKPQSSLKFTRPVSDCTGKKHSSPDWRYKSENIHDVVYDDDEKEKEMDKSQIDEKTRKLTYAPKRAGFDKKKREDSPNKEEEKITALSYDDYF